MRTDGIGFPKGLILAKPIGQESYKEEAITELQESGRLIIQRKHDGYKLLAIKGKDGRFRIWTVGGAPLHGRLAHITGYLEGLLFPVGTVLVGEGLMFQDGQERYEWTPRVFKGSDASGLRAQEQYGWAQFRVFQSFNLSELGNRDRQSSRPYGETLQWIAERLPDDTHASPVQTLYDFSYGLAKTEATREDWEGLVLTDTAYRLAWRLDGAKGKEPRPKGCYKYKPLKEDDFVVTPQGRIWHEDGRLKEVVLHQLDPETGALFSCGKLGTFSREVREELSANNMRPRVLQVAFERRNPDTGKLRFARFMRFRSDKSKDGCVAPASYPKAETA